MLTWDLIRERVQELSEERGEWAGAPLPIDGLKLRVESRYPWQRLNGFCFEAEEYEQSSRDADEAHVVNSWYSLRRDAEVYVWHNGDPHKRRSAMIPRRFFERYRMQLNTLAVCASPAFDVEAEMRAMATLREHITPHAFKCYVLSGGFLESSKRSQVTYWFRKLRPTIALGRSTTGDVTPLCALCLHPIGYYEESFSGVMVPTDDVIAHLLMMRADERKFWGKANHHPLYETTSGI